MITDLQVNQNQIQASSPRHLIEEAFQLPSVALFGMLVDTRNQYRLRQLHEINAQPVHFIVELFESPRSVNVVGRDDGGWVIVNMFPEQLQQQLLKWRTHDDSKSRVGLSLSTKARF
jgi:hypothetical protein